jgi:hypothetical protein
MDKEFDLQEFLAEMRKEQREDHKVLSDKVDIAVNLLHNHETRIVIVENMRKSVRWLIGAGIGGGGLGGVVAIWDFVVSHW